MHVYNYIADGVLVTTLIPVVCVSNLKCRRARKKRRACGGECVLYLE